MIDYRKLLSTLIEGKVEFVIVGGVAATIHGSARFTADLDVIYSRSRANIRRLITALAPLEPYLRGAPPGLPFRFDVETVRAGLNFTLATTAGPLDLLGEIAGGFDYQVARKRSMAVELYGHRCRVMDIAALIEAKMAAGRPKDLESIAELQVIREERR